MEATTGNIVSPTFRNMPSLCPCPFYHPKIPAFLKNRSNLLSRLTESDDGGSVLLRRSLELGQLSSRRENKKNIIFMKPLAKSYSGCYFTLFSGLSMQFWSFSGISEGKSNTAPCKDNQRPFFGPPVLFLLFHHLFLKGS